MGKRPGKILFDGENPWFGQKHHEGDREYQRYKEGLKQKIKEGWEYEA